MESELANLVDEKALCKIGKIIVADDSKLNLELMKLNLAEVGVTDNVTYCSDGKQAIEIAMEMLY